MCAPSLGPWGPKEDLQRIRASGLAAPVTPEGRQPIPSVLAAGAQLPILQKVGIINTKSLVLAFPGLSWWVGQIQMLQGRPRAVTHPEGRTP